MVHKTDEKRTSRILQLKQELNELSEKVNAVAKEDKSCLEDFDAIIRHCEQRLEKMNRPDPVKFCFESLEMEYEAEEIANKTTTPGGSPGETSSTAITAASPSSMSVLDARELFPGTPQSRASQTTQSSSPSPRSHFMRTITRLRGQQVQDLMSNMKAKLKRRGSI